VAFALLALLLGCAGPSGPSGGAATGAGESRSPTGAPKHITIVIRGNPFTLSEAINAAGSGSVPGVSEVEQLIHAGFASEDNDGMLRPKLVEEIPTVENGRWRIFPDGRMETSFRIRRNVVWHDGTPFTADDLLFTARVARDKQIPLSVGAMFEGVERVESPDPRQLVVTWSKPYIWADALFSRTNSSRVMPMPRHLLERALEEEKATFTQLPYWTRDFVGLGPFKLRELLEGSHLVAEANPRYVLGRPKIDSVDVKFIPDPNTIAANIMAGTVDLTLGGRFSLEWGLQVRDQWPNGRMEAPLEANWLALYPQLLSPTPAVLGDVQFRRALLHAVNRQEMADTIQAGLSPIAHSIIGPNQPEYKDVESQVIRYEYDPRRAAQLIEGLGYTKGSDGFYQNAAGQRLSFEVRTRQGDDLQEKTLFGVADYWQRAGLGVEPFIFPALRANDREFRAMRPAFEVVRQPGGSDALVRYHGGDTPLPENNFTGINRSRYMNAELDALIDRFHVTIPWRERMQVLGMAVNHMTSQVVAMGIYYAVDPTMISNRLQNVRAQNTAWNAHLWDLQS
jgi:peptide/nickel transport system substrate-binding protein